MSVLNARGSAAAERARPMPCDGLLPRASCRYDRSVTVGQRLLALFRLTSFAEGDHLTMPATRASVTYAVRVGEAGAAVPSACARLSGAPRPSAAGPGRGAGESDRTQT